MDKLGPRYEIVRKTQITLFKGWQFSGNDRDLIELLSPEMLAEHLNLEYLEFDNIPSGNSKFKTAGVLERKNRLIIVSREFSTEQRRLTGMHEVIHWMLHKHIGRDRLHRDRPIDHKAHATNSDYCEWEATQIACWCLMPEKLVERFFAETFLLPNCAAIELDESAAFYLDSDITSIRKMSLRQKSMKLATTSSFGRPIVPLYKQFKVSPTAMAIRLEELNLIAPDKWRGKPNLQVVR